MSRRCVALLSGGLDSMLAIRLMQQQGIEVEALNFKTVFTCCQDTSAQAARDLGVRLTIVGQEDDYLELVRKPRFGYGKGANPCVDCRIYMFDKAKLFMEQIDADFLVSGEVVGQRPMSQKRSDLHVISRQSGLDDLLLRPLSAKLMPPTLPEREGWVDRRQLYGFAGRGRKELIDLARELDLKQIPTPSTGCALTEPQFSKKVFDLVKMPETSRWDFELLRYGRHFRYDAATKVIVGRDEQDNDRLAFLASLPEATELAELTPQGFPGPVTLVVGRTTPDAIEFGAALMARYSRVPPQSMTIRLRHAGEERMIAAQRMESAEQAKTLAAR